MSKKLTEFDYHELLDRTSIIMMNIDTYLVNHQVSEKNKEIKDKLEKARTLLFDTYQIIGEYIIDTWDGSMSNSEKN
jgi:hypothetical protein